MIDWKQHWYKILLHSLTGLLVVGFLVYSQTKSFTILFWQPDLLVGTLLVSNLAGYLILISDRLLNKLFSWQSKMASRFLLGVLSAFLCLLFIALFSTVVFNIIYSQTDLSDFFSLQQDLFYKLAVLLFLVAFVFCIIDYAFYSFRQYSSSRVKTIKLAQEQLQLQVEMLKSQLSPHFLFNNLNTISSLIYRNHHIAEKYIRHLVYTYKYILNTHAKKLVPLKEELDFLQTYMYLLSIRFNDSLVLKNNIPENLLFTYIPPLSLQLLVENVAKHNALSTEKPICIEISTKNNYLDIVNNIVPHSAYIPGENNLTKRPEPKESLNIGLANIKKRYAYFTLRKVITEKKENFRVGLPIIKNNA